MKAFYPTVLLPRLKLNEKKKRWCRNISYETLEPLFVMIRQINRNKCWKKLHADDTHKRKKLCLCPVKVTDVEEMGITIVFLNHHSLF